MWSDIYVTHGINNTLHMIKSNSAQNEKKQQHTNFLAMEVYAKRSPKVFLASKNIDT